MRTVARSSAFIGAHRRFNLPAAIRAVILASAMVLAPAVRAWAAEIAESAPGGSAAKDPLATKQEIVRDRMTQLEDRMFRLTENLAPSHPEQAERLAGALRRARELLIRRNMDETIALLDEGHLTEAADRELVIVKGLEHLLKLLLEDPDNTRQRKKEIDQLREFRNQVRELLEAERELKARADAAGRGERLSAAVQAAIARLEALIEREREEIDKTSAATQRNDKAAVRNLGISQKQVRLETESLAGELSRTASPPTPNREPPDGNGQGEPEPTEAKVEDDIRKAGDEVNASAGQMRAAENELAQADAANALPMQKKARESLQRALKQLKRQQDALGKLLDHASAARQQRALEQRTGQLANRMQGKSSGGDSPGGKPQSGKPGDTQPGGDRQPGGESQQPPAPGTQNVRQAGEHMGQAADDLDQNRPAEASKDEEKAVDELENALDELERTLDQLRQEQQEEILRGLEARFRSMLARQLAVNEGTEELDRKGKASWTHSDELTLAGLAQDEQSLAGEAGQALHILKEEGTTIVFPRIVEQLRGDMVEVVGRLGDGQTGAETQRIEAIIVETLEELIEAVKQLREELEGGGGAGGGGSNPPLLPTSAELKLLRSCQERVNRQTVESYESHLKTGEWTPELQGQLQRTAERQRELAEMARKMNERVTGQ